MTVGVNNPRYPRDLRTTGGSGATECWRGGGSGGPAPERRNRTRWTWSVHHKIMDPDQCGVAASDGGRECEVDEWGGQSHVLGGQMYVMFNSIVKESTLSALGTRI